MNWQEACGINAAIVAAVSFIPYIAAMVRGETKPCRATWWIWSLVSGLLMLSYFESATQEETKWLPVTYFIGPFITAIAAMKYGKGGWTRLDRVCLVGTATSVMTWWWSGSAVLALGLVLVMDFLGFVPTVISSARTPQDENRLSWTIGLVANGLNTAAVKWGGLEGLINASYPVYMFAANVVINYFLWRPRR